MLHCKGDSTATRKPSTLTTAMLIPIGLGMMFALLLGYERYVRCPSHLRHLPRLPVWPIVKSLLSGETESSRIRRLIVPFADSRGCGLVLVWALGNWYAHIVDPVVSLLQRSVNGT
jgi:hypothetical protein